MASSRTMLAVGLAATTLVVFVVVIAMGGALRAGLAPWPGIAVAVLAVAAFAVSGERRSFVVAGLLGASGVVGVVYGLIRTDFLMASSFPGPIFGIILGLPILGLAVAEAVGIRVPGSGVEPGPQQGKQAAVQAFGCGHPA